MKKWAPRVLLAMVLVGASAFLLKGGCVDILDVVVAGFPDGNGGDACDRETVCRV